MKNIDKMFKALLEVLLIASMLFSIVSISNGALIVQNFESSWHVEVYDYYGYIAARAWDFKLYNPFDNNLGTLNRVDVTTRIIVSDITPGDDFRFRLSFFTGWAPVDYQFYTDEWYYDVRGNLDITRTYTFSTAEELQSWTDWMYGPTGYYWFESTTFNAGHTISASTMLTYDYTSVQSVAIDIKPGSFPNSINPKSKGEIPVAVLTTDTFDATTIDPATVRFGATGIEAPQVHSALEDLDGDGDKDMILHFNTQETGIQCGDTKAILTGETFSGQKIKGSDSIKTVGCK